MAYSITKQSGKETYGLTEFVINDVSELSTVPTDVASGSKVFDIDTGDEYTLSVIVSGSKTWKRTKKGTAAIPDPPTVQGTYQLNCTVDQDGVAIYSWE